MPFLKDRDGSVNQGWDHMQIFKDKRGTICHVLKAGWTNLLFLTVRGGTMPFL